MPERTAKDAKVRKGRAEYSGCINNKVSSGWERGQRMMEDEERERINRLSRQIITAAMRVHSTLGPGLLESAYEACLAYELTHQSLHAERQKALPLVYHEVQLDCGYRLDLLVEEAIIAELKTVEELTPLHLAQLLSYLKLSGCKLGLLINFHFTSLRSGIRRVANGL
jgi:GxxExxY protein